MRFSPLGPGAVDMLIGCNKSVYFSKNVLIEPPPLLGHVAPSWMMLAPVSILLRAAIAAALSSRSAATLS